MGEPLDLVVRSRRLRAQRFGPASASLVIAVHGLAGNMHQFDFLGDHLEERGLQLLAIDLRGRGDSAPTGPGTYGWENHALDVLAAADVLGVERFGLLGLSMGGSVAMKAAEFDGDRLTAMVLLDVAGRVDPGVGPAVDAIVARLDQAPGFADAEAVAEDRRYTVSQDPYARWQHLTMPTLLVRATRELAPGAGFVVPAADRDRFQREVPNCIVVEIDADHRTIATHPDTAVAVGDFLLDVHP